TTTRRVGARPRSRAASSPPCPWLESENARLERRLERHREQKIGQRDDADGESGGGKRMAPLGAEGQRKQQQRHRDEEAQRLVERDGGGGDRDDPRRVRQIAPRNGREGRALVGAQDEQQTEQDHEASDELRHHARAGKRQRADRQIAAERKHQEAEGDEDAAGDVVATQSHGLSVPLALISPSASPRVLAPKE